MTVCNMTIEAGARAGLIACDQTTLDYIAGRPFAPSGELWDQAVAFWGDLHSDDDAVFDREVVINAGDIAPQVTWGTSPEMVCSINQRIPDPAAESDTIKAGGMQAALDYMGLKANTPFDQVVVDKVFIGSCTNSRIEDLRAAAECRQGTQAGSEHQACAGGARFGSGQAAGRGRRAGPDICRRRFRVARAGLFDVPGDERRPARAG